MTDRELLELAAKAAGYEHYNYVENEYRDGRKVTGHYDSLLEVCINPLTDDGDALRLAVKLGMNVFQAAKSAYAVPSDDGTYEEQVRYSDAGNDPYAATRRAIVRAAAEIGEAMKEY